MGSYLPSAFGHTHSLGGEAHVDVSEVTRRAIADEMTVRDIAWGGQLGDDEFLGRLYDLSKLPSHDHRFKDADGDIWKHMVMNRDWATDWMFTDSRFRLLWVPDEEFLKFLCASLHPMTRREVEQVTQLRDLYNRHLVADGWEVYEQTSISDRPVFGARRLLDGSRHAIEAAQSVAEQFGPSYINQQVTRLNAAVQDDPELAIGTAKEFIETVSRTILSERAVTIDPNWDVQQLVRRAMEELELVPDKTDNAAKAAISIKALLGNLSQVSQRMAELRNAYGTGHGKAARSQGLQPRHARLAVGAATSLAVFLFETYQEKYGAK